MNENHLETYNDKWIVANRGEKNSLNSQKPYDWLVEKERTASGKIEEVGTVFLTNKECPFHCLMCDLWKNTIDKAVSVGDIPSQIEWALLQMPKVKHLKLYNNGSFFDKKAIPKSDYSHIAKLLERFETVIVESHPKFINESCIEFKNLLKPKLQVAIGLETVHPKILQKLNKKMTLDDFKKAVNFLQQEGISSRAFILLRPPYLTETEGIYWAKKSIDFAFKWGVESCVVIPVRAGNGAMDVLLKKDHFHSPTIQSLEAVLAYGLSLNSGRVFADIWDVKYFSNCHKCIDKRIQRLTHMNLNQQLENKVLCSCSLN